MARGQRLDYPTAREPSKARPWHLMDDAERASHLPTMVKMVANSWAGAVCIIRIGDVQIEMKHMGKKKGEHDE